MGKKHVGIDIWWPERPESWGVLRRYLMPHPGTLIMTLLLVGGLLWAGSVGAIPLRAPATATTSTGTIAYQGRLADSAGKPITDPVNLDLRLYGLADGGAPLGGGPPEGRRSSRSRRAGLRAGRAGGGIARSGPCRSRSRPRSARSPWARRRPRPGAGAAPSPDRGSRCSARPPPRRGPRAPRRAGGSSR